VKVITDATSGIEFSYDTDISKIDLYIFEEDGRLMGKMHDVAFNQWVNIYFKGAGKLNIVALANATNDEVTLSGVPGTSTITQNAFTLKASQPFASYQLYNAPGDIFFGSVEMDNDENNPENKELPVRPLVSKINVKLKGLQNYAMQTFKLTEMPSDKDFTFVIRTKHLSYDFRGNPCNTPAYYKGKEIVSYEGISEVPTLNMLSTPTGEQVVIYVYHKDRLMDTISETTYATRSSGKVPLTVSNGKLLEVYVNYQSGLVVSLQNPDWKEGGLMWKEF